MGHYCSLQLPERSKAGSWPLLPGNKRQDESTQLGEVLAEHQEEFFLRKGC